MSTPNEKRERRVIPRWRKSSKTMALGEAASVTDTLNKPVLTDKQKELDSQILKQKHDEWVNSGSIGLAVDLLNSAFVLGQTHKAYNAADFIIQHPSEVTPEVVNLANKVINGQTSFDMQEPLPFLITSEQIYLEIQIYKQRVKQFPRQPLVWLDLARSYLILGQIEKAEKALRIALALAPNHRLSVRAAVRFLLHLHEPEKAEYLLRNTPSLLIDPWLIATEISISTILNRPPKFIKQARQMIKSANFKQFHLSELTAALGTLELFGANSKKARELFRESLQDPTENAVAQAEYVERVHKVPTDYEKYYNHPYNFEARTWESYSQNRFVEALNECRLWLNDEPFSKRPAFLAAFLIGLLDLDMTEAIQIMQRCYTANPHDSEVLNQMTYIHASTNQLKDAKSYFQQISYESLDNRGQIVWNGNKGLLEFRERRFTEGRFYYYKAIELAQQTGQHDLLASAAIFLGREEKYAKDDLDAMRRAFSLAEKVLPVVQSSGLDATFSKLNVNSA
jgi:tetratricopeptide (TPR) repeat protein